MRSSFLVRCLAMGLSAAATACTTCGTLPSPPLPPPVIRANQPDLVWCPGNVGCMTTGKTQLLAGAGKRSVVPRGFEIANIHYLETTDCDPLMEARFGVRRCGAIPELPDDCGTDGLCPNDVGYPGPDADGTQRDDRPDYFLDCGLDRLCPGNVPEAGAEATDGVDNDGDGAIDDGPYVAPDDGEGDGVFTAAWIAGFGANRPAMGVHDDVEVRCLALRTHETTAVLCSLDAVGFFNSEIQRARARLKQRHAALDVDYLAISSTHTHESVDTMGQWGRADPLPTRPGRLEYFHPQTGSSYIHNSFVVDQIVEAAAEAVGALTPARLVLAQTQTGADGFLRDSMDPQIMDDTMTVVEAQSLEGGAAIFTAVHWGNHPEILAGDNSLISSDYVGVVRHVVERGLPATHLKPAMAGRGGMVIYIQGTVGGLMTQLGVDVVGRDGAQHPAYRDTYARMDAYGENLGEIALGALTNPVNQTVVTDVELQVKAEKFFIPVKNGLFVFGFAAGLFDRLVYNDDSGAEIDPQGAVSLFELPISVETEVFTLDVGPWSLVGVPGEIFPEMAVGGYDGSKSFGRPIIAPDYCPPASECRSSREGESCPEERPTGGYADCACEQCRLCSQPVLDRAPGPPYLKGRVPGAYKMMVGLANDELGYLVPSFLFKVSEKSPFTCQARHHYPETNSTGPFAVPRVEEALQKLFDFTL